MKQRLKNLIKNYDSLTTKEVAKELLSIYWKFQDSTKSRAEISKRNSENRKKGWDKKRLGVAFASNVKK